MARPDCESLIRLFGNSWSGCEPGMYREMNPSEIHSFISISQAFSPASVIFAGIGALLSVRIIRTFVRAIVTALPGSYGCSRKPGQSDRHFGAHGEFFSAA